MIGNLDSPSGGMSRGVRCHARGAVVFWGSPLAFSDWILRVAEAESGAMDVIRVDDLDGLALPDGTSRFIFFDDGVADYVLAERGAELPKANGSRWVLAYRDEALARRLLALRRERPEYAAMGFLPMNLPIDIWTSMFRLVLSGDFVVPGRLLEPVAAQVPHPTAPIAAENGTLTRREREVLTLVAQGMRNKTIAHTLELSEHTIKLHLHHVISKIGVRNRTQAAQWYLTRSHGGAR
jgi:DNA-binding CsgD family transcriptional regulator